MAFNFLGTIDSIDDFEALVEFVTVEINRNSDRVNHLNQEIQRNRLLLDRFKVADLKMRAEYKLSDQADSNWLLKSRPIENLKIKQVDGANAVDVDTLKRIVLDSIKFKREKNEFKILRIRDLIEQMQDEISFLTDRRKDYTDYIDRIRGRFKLPDYTELQMIPQSDVADVQQDLRAIPKDAGKEIVGGVTYYLIVNINASFNTITFDYSAPPVKYGDILILTSGKNNGPKTVFDYKDSRTIIVQENLVSETPSVSKATVQKGAL